MIRKLPPHLVHQIAAGEVVERPASVLKELIENSVDAGASRIQIVYEDAGLKFLSVEDDGRGIPSSDLSLAFEAHATSKLEKFEDFEALSTFGFRGEALCSISAVAEVEIWTTAASDLKGSRGRVSFGSPIEAEAGDRRVGTRVSVRNLFQKLPARLKFLKSERSENLALSAVWKRYALAYPEIHFEIEDRSSQKKISLAKSTFVDRVQWFFDSEENSHWIEIQGENEDWKVKGWLLRPRFFGKIRAGTQFYLNRRPFKDPKIEFALKRGLEGFSLFPKDVAAVFYIEGDPRLFDVNVHPTKIEVRFLKPDILFSLLVHSIRDRLQSEHRVDLEARKPLAELQFSDPIPDRQPLSSFSSVASMTSPNENLEPQFASPQLSEATFTQTKIFQPKSSFEFLGAIDDTFLLARRALDLWVFDQHALHERVLYERLLKEKRETKNISSQRLLFPLPLRFEGAETLLEREDLLCELGFEIRLWKEGEVRLVAAPAVLKRDHDKVLCRLVNSIDQPLETVLQDALATMACHGAVRAHDALAPAEVEKLLRDFESEDALGHCPHGRPTFVKLQSRDFEKMFQRVV